MKLLKAFSLAVLTCAVIALCVTIMYFVLNTGVKYFGEVTTLVLFGITVFTALFYGVLSGKE